jgi:two-component system LytT family response regulator
LLKPIDIEDLRRGIEKVKNRKSDSVSERIQHLLENLRSGPTNNSKLPLPTAEGLVFVNKNDILYCKAESNYTEITLADNKKYLVSRTLKEYDDILSDQNFFRIHHSYLINLNGIKKYVRGEGGYVIMNNDTSLDVSKRKKEAFLEKIGAKA